MDDETAGKLERIISVKVTRFFRSPVCVILDLLSGAFFYFISLPECHGPYTKCGGDGEICSVIVTLYDL